MTDLTSDTAHDYIRKRILNGEFPKGRLLKAGNLSKAIGVSRTPVREALQRLEADGLVEIEPGFGARVKVLEFDQFLETCLMRQALESLMAGLAAEFRTEFDLREMAANLKKMEEIAVKLMRSSRKKERALMAEMMRADTHFHIAVMTAARKPGIKKEILRLQLINRVMTWDDYGEALGIVGRQNRAMRDDEIRRGLKAHRQVYKAIREGRPDAARDAMSRQIQHIIDYDLERLRVRGDPERTGRMTDEEQLLAD